LRFGTATGVGISSTRSPGGFNSNGMDFWTGGTKKLMITPAGYVGINLPPNTNPSSLLHVNGSITAGFFYCQGFINAEADITTNDDLIAHDDGIINGDLIVDGTSTLSGKITNQGKGIMLSNSTTTLRTGFTQGTFTLSLPAGNFVDLTFGITPFTGDNDNVRVMIAQLTPGTGASLWGSIVISAHSALAADPAYQNQSTCKVRFHNAGSSTANLGTNATLYLMSVVTN